MIEIRQLARDEYTEYTECMELAFGTQFSDDPLIVDRVVPLIEFVDESKRGQFWVAVDRDQGSSQIVGGAATYDLTVAVPGGQVAMAGLTAVSVRATHRRQGILRRLVDHHLADANSRGYPVSGLWASEASIYTRFGFGVAAFSDSISIQQADRLHFRQADPTIKFKAIDVASARSLLPAIYQRAAQLRPGALLRSDLWWQHRRFTEGSARAGASGRRHVVAYKDGTAIGYVAFRQRNVMALDVPSGTIEIIELVATSSQVEEALWRFICNVDLFPNVKWSFAPSDCSLPWIVDDARRIERRPYDNIWIRINDVETALQSRKYLCDETLCFQLQGEHDVWRLEVDNGTAAISKVGQKPDAILTRAALGSLFLGGVSSVALASGSHIVAEEASLLRLDRLFCWHRAPCCFEIF